MTFRRHYTGKIPALFLPAKAMQYRLHQDFSEVPWAEWNQLASEGISDTPFARFEYMELWWNTRGGGEWPYAELALVSAWEDQRLIGLAPLFKAVHDGSTSLLLVGSIEISDYLDVIVRPDDVERFVRGLLDFLAASPAIESLPLDWFNVPDVSPTLRALRLEAERRGWTYSQEIFRSTPQIALPADFEAYLAGLDKKQRHEIRRKLRRASEGTAPAHFELVEGPDIQEDRIEDFLDLMAHDPEKAEFLDESMRQHMRLLIRLAWEQGYLWMAFLRVNGAAAAAAFNFDYGDRLWAYNSAVNRDFLELSPGWVLLTHQIRWACEHGRTVFDFMRGDEDYKYRFGGMDRHVLRVRVARS
jgi:CelD/BcsL family acetyltransferase involved in cellulose biosynthesis